MKTMYKAKWGWEFDSLEKVDEFNSGADECYSYDFEFCYECQCCALYKDCKQAKIDRIQTELGEGIICEEEEILDAFETLKDLTGEFYGADDRIKFGCPFCGQNRKLIQIFKEKDGLSKIKCSQCGASIEGYSDKDVIEMWNKRA